MPNAIIAAGMAIFIGSSHLHHRQDNEEENVAMVEGITEADVDNVEEDVVGDNKVPKELQRMLLGSHWDQMGLHLNCSRGRFHP